MRAKENRFERFLRGTNLAIKFATIHCHMQCRVVVECVKTGLMQQCCGVCQDGTNAAVLWIVSRWAKCNNVLECAKRNQMQQMFWNVPRWAKCNSVLECVKMGKMQQMFLMCQDRQNATVFFLMCQDWSNATMFWNVPRQTKCNK